MKSISTIIEEAGVDAKVFEYAKDEAVINFDRKGKILIAKLDKDGKFCIIASKGMNADITNIDVRFHKRSSGKPEMVYINIEVANQKQSLCYNTFQRSFIYTSHFEEVYTSVNDYYSDSEGNLQNKNDDILKKRRYSIAKMPIIEEQELEVSSLHGLKEERVELSSFYKTSMEMSYYVVLDADGKIHAVAADFEEALSIVRDYYHLDITRTLDYLVGNIVTDEFRSQYSYDYVRLNYLKRNATAYQPSETINSEIALIFRKK